MTAPITTGWEQYFSSDSPYAQNEWQIAQQRRKQLVDDILKQRELAAGIQQDTGTNAEQAQSIADSLVNRQRPPLPTQDSEFTQEMKNQLYGAAQSYGIPDYEKIPLPTLNQIVEARRLLAVKTNEGKSIPLDQAFKTSLGLATVGITQGVLGAVQNVPFIGDWIADRGAVQELSQNLNRLNEDMAKELPANQLETYKALHGLYGAIGYAIPAGWAWEAAGAIGELPAIAKTSTRLSPIVRSAARGAMAGWLMEGGGDSPIGSRAEKIATWAGTSGLMEAAAPYLGRLFTKLQENFQRPFDAGDVSGANPTPPPQTVDAEWEPIHEPQRLLTAGGDVGVLPSGNPFLPPGQYNVSPAVPKRLPMGGDEYYDRYFQEAFDAGFVDTGTMKMAENPAVQRAASDAIGMTKVSTVMESPDLHNIAAQPTFNDADVAVSAMRSRPAAIQIVEGIGDGDHTVSELLRRGISPAEFRLVQRGSRSDLLVSNGLPITEELANEYQQYGLFTGQRMVLDGSEGTVASVKPEGALFKTADGKGSMFLERGIAYDLAYIWKASDAGSPIQLGIANAPELYTKFQTHVMDWFDREAGRAGLQPKDWTSPEVASVLPARLNEFLDAQGFTNHAQRAALEHYFSWERGADYQILEPEAMIQMKQLVAEANATVPVEVTSTSDPAAFEALQQTGYYGSSPHVVNLPVGEAGQIGTVDAVRRARELVGPDEFRRQASTEFTARGATTPDTQNAAIEHTARRIVSELQPVIHDVAEPLGFTWQNYPETAGGTLLDRVSGQSFPMENEAAAREFLKHFKREPVDLTPPSDVPLEIGELPVGAQHPGVTSDGSMSEEMISDALISHLEHLESGLEGSSVVAVPPSPSSSSFGGAAIPPSIPPDIPVPPAGGSGFGGEPPQLPPGENTLGSQFARARRQGARIWELNQEMDSIWLRYLTPWRDATLRLTSEFADHGIDARSLWKDYNDIESGTMTAHSEARDWHNQIEDIMAAFPRKLVRNGTVTRVAEIADHNERIAEMTRLGYTPKMRSAQNALEDLNNRFFSFMVNDPTLQFNPNRYIFGYMSHVRNRMSMGMDDPYVDAEGKLGPFSWFARYAREGGLNPRQMNAAWLEHYMIRAAMFEKHVAPTYNAMQEAWKDPRIPEKIRREVTNWLGVVRAGYNPEYQVAIQGARHTLNKLGVPVTDGDMQKFWSLIMRTMYRSGIGFKPAAIFRDSIQPWFAWTKYGHGGDMASVYHSFVTDPATRAAAIQRGVDGGWIERGQVRSSEATSFERVLTPEGTDLFSPAQNTLREGVNNLADLVHDNLPPAWRGGIRGWADPMYIYGEKLGLLNKAVSGETGWRVASKALDDYRAGRITRDVFLKESSTRMQPAVLRDEIIKQLDTGNDEEVKRLIGQAWADTQFRYGIRNAPMGLRSLAGRMASMWGNFTLGYMHQMKEGLTGGTAADRAAFVMRQFAIAGAISTVSNVTGWKGFNQWLWHTSLAFAGGPLALGVVKTGEAITGAIANLSGAHPSPDQQQAAQDTFGPPRAGSRSLLETMNPYSGLFNTAAGIANAAGGVNPTEDIARFLMTGDQSGVGAGPTVTRWYDGLTQGAPGSVVNPQTPPTERGSRTIFQLPGTYDRTGRPLSLDSQPVTPPAVISAPAPVGGGHWSPVSPNPAKRPYTPIGRPLNAPSGTQRTFLDSVMRLPAGSSKPGGGAQQ